ncbi:MAG: sigma factor-like helix-turn-helix DNA-binding protein [Bacteroidota bacterium]
MTGQAGSLTDERLLKELRQKSPDAFDIVVRRYKDPLIACARWLAGGGPEEAHTIVKSVFLRLYFSRRGIRRTSKLSSWLFGETIRLARSRTRQRHLAGVMESWVRRKSSSRKADPRREYLQRELSRDRESPEVATVRKGIDALSAPMREIVVLRDFLELSSDEIGGILNMSAAAVESRAEEARALLERRSYMRKGG